MNATDTGSGIQIAVLVLLLLLSAFFSSAETALTTVNKIRIHTLVEQGNKKARTLSKILGDSGKMLSTILIGNNIVNISSSALATSLTIKLFGNAFVGIATGIITLLVLIFGEITPKTMATLHSESISLNYAKVIWTLMILFTPLVFIVQKLSYLVMLLLRIDPNAKPGSMTEHELRTIVNVSQEEGVIENEEKEIIYNLFDFGDTDAKDVMIPRIDMCMIDVEASYEDLMSMFREEMHTRFPVYEEDTDHIIGIVNVKDLLLLDDTSQFSIRSIMREAYFTYEHKNTASLLLEMREASISLAIVLDEYGATAGLVSLEDLLEEIVGEIRDEYDEDEEEEIITIREDKEYLILGSTKLDDVNDALGTDFESEEYDSIGGFIIEQLDSIPVLGQTVSLPGNCRLVVTKLDKKRIEKVRLYFDS